MSQREGWTLIPRDLHCYDDMVIVTHAVSWRRDGECAGNPKAMKIIQSLCDGRNSCYIEHSKSILGGSCGTNFDFTMYYSCQTGNNGIFILLTKREGRTGSISARGLDSTDRAPRGPYKKDRGPIFSQCGPEQAWVIRDLLYDCMK